MAAKTPTHVYKHLTRIGGELYELLNQINPPALDPLPANRDVPATLLDEATPRVFSAVRAAYDAVEAARRAVLPASNAERVNRTYLLREILHSRPEITRTEVLQLLRWDDEILDQTLGDLEQVAIGQIAASA